jgi:hypothetical protein
LRHCTLNAVCAPGQQQGTQATHNQQSRRDALKFTSHNRKRSVKLLAGRIKLEEETFRGRAQCITNRCSVKQDFAHSLQAHQKGGKIRLPGVSLLCYNPFASFTIEEKHCPASLLKSLGRFLAGPEVNGSIKT